MKYIYLIIGLSLLITGGIFIFQPNITYFLVGFMILLVGAIPTAFGLVTPDNIRAKAQLHKKLK